MNNLAEIETAVDCLSSAEKEKLLYFLAMRLEKEKNKDLQPHGKASGWLWTANGSIHMAASETADDARMACYSAHQSEKLRVWQSASRIERAPHWEKTGAFNEWSDRCLTRFNSETVSVFVPHGRCAERYAYADAKDLISNDCSKPEKVST